MKWRHEIFLIFDNNLIRFSANKLYIYKCFNRFEFKQINLIDL